MRKPEHRKAHPLTKTHLVLKVPLDSNFVLTFKGAVDPSIENPVAQPPFFPPRYQQLLSEIHQCYLEQREHLLGPSITSTVTELTNRNNRDHCALVSPLGWFLSSPFLRNGADDWQGRWLGLLSVFEQPCSGGTESLLIGVVGSPLGYSKKHLMGEKNFTCLQAAVYSLQVLFLTDFRFEAAVPLWSMCARMSISFTMSSSQS